MALSLPQKCEKPQNSYFLWEAPVAPAHHKKGRPSPYALRKPSSLCYQVTKSFFPSFFLSSLARSAEMFSFHCLSSSRTDIFRYAYTMRNGNGKRGMSHGLPRLTDNKILRGGRLVSIVSISSTTESNRHSPWC